MNPEIILTSLREAFNNFTITWGQVTFLITFLLINVISYVIIKDAGATCKGCVDIDCDDCTSKTK